MVSNYTSPKGRSGIVQSDNNSNIIVWGEFRDSSGLFAQKIDSLGIPLWNQAKRIMSHSPYTEDKVITDGNNGAIIVWRIDPPWGGIYAQQISKNGNLGEIITSVNEDNNNINPGSFYLAQNYPNPFNPVTIIRYEIPGQARNDIMNVQLIVYDILGNKIATLVNEEKPAGRYEVEFSTGLINQTLPSGIYFYQLRAGGFVETKKMVLMR